MEGPLQAGATMSANVADAKQIFLQAVENHEPERWPEFLQDACGTDTVLRERVEALLTAYRQPNRILDSSSHQATLELRSITEQPGTVIGPYKLLEQIGEGGMGVVFMAEQSEPVRRRVALKIIKPGMDTRQVIARFEAERQALAMMDHPNIAKVLDAGTTDTGRPYFVMELVRGVPITEYCDQCNLTTRERLELFVTVCQAVQHAHQKGIIHRDLKPTNVLVAMQDGRPAPKIIDFGVAKAIGQQLTEHTLTTAFAQMVGTPLYMSPEQAELSPLGVDTRSDIYSLGVLLYELLTGTTPFDKDRLHAAAYDEMRRIIREEEPPRPSARISTLAAELASTVAEHRRTDARRLQQASPRRARLDRDEVPRKGPQPPLRNGQQPGPRHRALSARRAGAGLPAVGQLPLPQIRPPQQDGAGCRRSNCRTAFGRPWAIHLAVLSRLTSPKMAPARAKQSLTFFGNDFLARPGRTHQGKPIHGAGDAGRIFRQPG